MSEIDDYETVTIEVRNNTFRSVGYRWRGEGEKVTLQLRYEGEEAEPVEIFTPLLDGCDSRVRDLVEVLAGWLYHASLKR